MGTFLAASANRKVTNRLLEIKFNKISADKLYVIWNSNIAESIVDIENDSNWIENV